MRKILLFSLLVSLNLLSVRAYDFKVDGIYYEIIGTTEVAVVAGEALYSGSVVIPTEVVYNGATYSVTSIGEDAFVVCSDLTSVTIPEGVTTIWMFAFYGCSGLTSVSIPASVISIEQGAFEDCSGLTSVTIPESVTSIGESAFGGCTGLTSVPK